MAWSSRGFPFLIVAVLAILHRGGTRVAVVFHEPNRQGGSRWIDRIRGACQGWVIRTLYRRAAKAIFTVPLETVDWLPKAENKSAFIPIGANIPERVNHRLPSAVDQEKTVIVFGVTGAPATAGEVIDIAHVMREASKALASLRLVIVGRGGDEAQGLLRKAFDGCDMQVVVRGVLPAEEIASQFAGADALLFVRGAVSLRRGTVMAGIACGVPIVGYRDGGIGGPLDGAGVEWSTERNRQSLARALVRVLTDSKRWTELHERNLECQKAHFGWATIAAQFSSALDTVEATESQYRL
jgi:glycosyltransferase involved in cell wall biosynthesis